MKSIKIYTLFLYLIISLFFQHNNHGDCYAAEYSKFDEIARFLAGKSISRDSKLYSFTQSNYYKNYTRSLNTSWNKFQKPNLQKIKDWWQKHKSNKPYQTVYYPFSGPDIKNALTFFPDGKKYIMFGLEPPGLIPNPNNMTTAQLHNGLNSLKKSISFILQINFFRTLEMGKELGKKSFNNITGVVMFFLAINDYEIIDVKRIAIDKTGAVVNWQQSDELIRWTSPSKDKRIPGVQITFRKNNFVQTMEYFNLNVADQALKDSSYNFIKYMQNQKPYNTVVKAASYLPHYDMFTKIRETILGSDFIVQDESGVPLKYLPSNDWKVKVHGYYLRPVNLFLKFYQKELYNMMKKNSTGILPFSYGYNYHKDKSHLITVEKIQNR